MFKSKKISSLVILTAFIRNSCTICAHHWTKASSSSLYHTAPPDTYCVWLIDTIYICVLHLRILISPHGLPICTITT